MQLRPYQEDAVHSCLQWLREGKNPLLVMPTGTGKTVTVGAILKEYGRPTVVLAHRRELLQQARHTFQQMGVQSKVMSIQSFARRPVKAPLYWVDEAHHAVLENSTYASLLGMGGQILGCTATPDRPDELPWDDFFQGIAYQYSLEQAIKDGWLVKPRLHMVQDTVYPRNEMVRLINTLPSPIICYVPRVKTAQWWQERMGGVVVHGGLKDKDRDTIAAGVRGGSIDLIFNALLYSEGFDAPNIRSIIINRHSLSLLLLTQIMGRALRLSEGKEVAHIAQVITDRRETFTINQVVGLPPHLDGGDLMEEWKERDRFEREYPGMEARWFWWRETWKEVRQRAEIYV